MLVLSRMVDEVIKLNIPAGTVFTDAAEITITVNKTGKQTKLGIEAPPCVRILRAEVDVVIADPPYGFREAGPVEDLPPEEAQP